MPQKNKIDIQTQPRLIETDAFSFEFISGVAERESWRKELYRPIYHVHKWWAKRLGSVFRGILLGCLLPKDANLEDAFYQKHAFSNVSVLDPFLGSGVTVGEAHKLGCISFGQDINPVACESVRVALGPLERNRLLNAFSHLSVSVGDQLRALYQSKDEAGRPCDVLYYFWVKCVTCPNCVSRVDLFSSRVIARNAYPDRKPEIQVCCPGCGDIFPALNTDKIVSCPICTIQFSPEMGAASGANATCSTCHHLFSIAEAVRSTGLPPAHRLYAKLLLTPEGNKHYLATTSDDIHSYEACSYQLEEALAERLIQVPQTQLEEGVNTRQAIGYNYRAWRDFFNNRQLLALGLLHNAITLLPDASTRDALLTLFSGLLEFNNLFASYKGEGTGAVRHMFSHHILKPERTPIEANVWGTPKSSGSFTNLFHNRLLRALDYRDAPFEVSKTGTGKVFHTSLPFSGNVETSFPTANNYSPHSISLSCGSSDHTTLPSGSIDLVVTDPPFFDNVHYSELADFFYAWQTLYPRGFINSAVTTRHPDEVQDADAARFATKLGAVFVECYRLLKEDGLLVFTYHHSRTEGWYALVEAIIESGFSVVNAHPVKSEMSVATPKSQTKVPIQLDVILVCKKREKDLRTPLLSENMLLHAVQRARQKLNRLEAIGLKLSQNDRRITLIGQFIAELGPVCTTSEAIKALQSTQVRLEDELEFLSDSVDLLPLKRVNTRNNSSQQISFEF